MLSTDCLISRQFTFICLFETAHLFCVFIIMDSEADVDDAKAVVKRNAVDVRLCDFDNTSYHVSSDRNDSDLLTVSMKLPCYKFIENKGGRDALQTIYGDMVTQTEKDHDISLLINYKNNLDRAAVTQKVAALKHNIVGGAFSFYFDSLLKGSPQSQSHRFKMRDDTEVFLVPRPDRVFVIFSLAFSDRTDNAVANVFMQEFVVTRNRLGAAPPCSFSQKAPLELKEFGNVDSPNLLGFLTFGQSKLVPESLISSFTAVMKSHLEQGRNEKVTAVLQSFRTFLQYHIKCSKSYFHSRMRARVASLLKVLNRAKVEPPADKKEMKTMSGRSFERKV